MKIVYRAADILEAHIVAGMLQAQGIDCHVGGHYLQGAVGDLAMQGFANVQVGEDDFYAAQLLITEYESARSEEELPDTLSDTQSDNLPDTKPWLA